MALTISDRNRMYYAEKRSQGMTHEEAINDFPEQLREIIEKDVTMSATESHYGMSAVQLLIVVFGSTALICAIVFYCCGG